ncbi:MAG TPA: hypothetical protein VFH45_00405 [Acidimicrobiales bacterium]|nr:hypothetical protein [Acidimicrobiales bacterium]
MTDVSIRMWVAGQALLAWMARRAAPGERGEGVVSLAIGVVIMAFLGALLWVAFKATLGHATQNVDTQVSKIGQ